MNGEVCCILGVCCPPGSEAQAASLAKEMVKDGVCSENPEAQRVAAWVLKHFDLAPAGTLTQFKHAIVQVVKHANPL